MIQQSLKYYIFFILTSQKAKEQKQNGIKCKTLRSDILKSLAQSLTTWATAFSLAKILRNRGEKIISNYLNNLPTFRG